VRRVDQQATTRSRGWSPIRAIGWRGSHGKTRKRRIGGRRSRLRIGPLHGWRRQLQHGQRLVGSHCRSFCSILLHVSVRLRRILRTVQLTLHCSCCSTHVLERCEQWRNEVAAGCWAAAAIEQRARANARRSRRQLCFCERQGWERTSRVELRTEWRGSTGCRRPNRGSVRESSGIGTAFFAACSCAARRNRSASLSALGVRLVLRAYELGIGRELCA